MQCAAGAVPQDHAHVLVKLATPSHGPGHQVEQLMAASTLPVQKYPAVSVLLFLPFCLREKKIINEYIKLVFLDSKYVYGVSVDLVVFCSPPPPHVHPDVL